MDALRTTLPLLWGAVSVLEWRAGATPPLATILLLHGGGVDNASLSWGGLGPLLADAGYRVIAPDHPGYGESPLAPWPATQERLVGYVGDVVDALNLERYVVGGLSLGGGMAIGHVLDRPRPIDAAILMGSYGVMDRLYTGPLSLPKHVAIWMMLRSGLLTAAMRAYSGNRARLQRSMRALIRNPAQLTTELLDEIVAATQRDSALAAFEQWQRDQVQWNRLRTNYFAQLSAFSCPTLIVHGERDTGVPIAQARQAAEHIPAAGLVVAPDAGHWVQRDRPDIVIPAMLRFLSGVVAGR